MAAHAPYATQVTQATSPRESPQMPVRPILRVVLCVTAFMGAAAAQEAPLPPMPQLSPGTARKSPAEVNATPAQPQSMALTVPKGTPLQVALDQEVGVKKVGQTIRGGVVDPVYAFDHVVIPVGSEVSGQITKIEPITRGKRTLAALDADFSPVRNIEVT